MKPGAALRGLGTGRRNQQGFLFARELTVCARARLFAECCLQVAEHEALLGPVDGRAANAHIDRDLVVVGPRIGGQSNLRSLELARGVLNSAYKRGEPRRARFGSVQPGSVHSSVPPPHSRHGRTAELDGGRELRGEKTSRPSRANISRLSTFTRGCTAGRQPKPTCRNIFASAHLRFTRWCSRSNGQD